MVKKCRKSDGKYKRILQNFSDEKEREVFQQPYSVIILGKYFYFYCNTLPKDIY
jgi:hypothetical protein